MRDFSFQEAIEKAASLIDVGAEQVWLRDSSEKPWHLVSEAEAGSTWRLNGPASVRFYAKHESGLTFTWSEDFEDRDASGRGVSLFDRAKLRKIILRLPIPARKLFGAFLEKEVLPGLEARSDEIREALNRQLDSEDCVRGLIAFASQTALANADEVAS